MTPDELRAELAAGTVRPAYLVVGEELLYRDDALAAIQSAVLSSGPVDFNFEKLEADASPAALIDATQTLPVDTLQVSARLNRYFHCLSSCRYRVIIISS